MENEQHITKTTFEALETTDPSVAHDDMTENFEWSFGTVDILDWRGYLVRHYVILDDEGEPDGVVLGDEPSHGENNQIIFLAPIFETSTHEKTPLVFDCDFNARLVNKKNHY